MNMLSKIADVAQEDVGLKEIKSNYNPQFQKFWNATSYVDGMSDRAPYCAAAVSYWVQEAQHRLAGALSLHHVPRYAAVTDWLDWAKDNSNGVLVVDADNPKGYAPDRGDLVCFLPHFSHIGVVSKLLSGSRIETIEANTSNGDFGSQRDGDGIYNRIRPLSICGYFFKIPVKGEKV